MKAKLKILAFAASIHSKSINKILVTYAAKTLKDKFVTDAQVEILDLNSYEMPIYSQDREAAKGIPQEAYDFYNKIGSADILLISYAEHNGSYTAAFKNIYDWASRIDMKVYQNKPMLMLATSPGARGGAGVLQAASGSAPFFGAELKGSLSIPSFYDNFDLESNQFLNENLHNDLLSILDVLISN